jgi:hypothetical protein
MLLHNSFFTMKSDDSVSFQRVKYCSDLAMYAMNFFHIKDHLFMQVQ